MAAKPVHLHELASVDLDSAARRYLDRASNVTITWIWRLLHTRRDIPSTLLGDPEG